MGLTQPTPGSEDAMNGPQKLRHQFDELNIEFGAAVERMFEFIASERTLSINDPRLALADRPLEAVVRTLLMKKLIKHVGEESVAPTWKGWLCYGGVGYYLCGLSNYQK